jgi:elongation factor Ts
VGIFPCGSSVELKFPVVWLIPMCMVLQTTKLKKGQELKGTVKNIIRNGAFIAFAEEGEEGFLRGSEITEGGENVAVDTLLTVGQEVTVRVLKIERGKAALTMKPQVDMTSINDSLNTNVGAGGASNPFATFFRSANLVPASASAAPEEVAETPAPAVAEETSAVLETPAVEEEETLAPVDDTPAVEETPSTEAAQSEEAPAAETSAVLETPAVEEEETQAPADETPAVEETPSTEAAQSEEAPAAEESKEAEEPHSMSLGEIAENIGGAVAEIEKVVEAAAGTVRDNVAG